MSFILTDIGEEWYTETAIEGATVSVTVYNDGNDNVSDTDNVAAITEPSGGSYSRESTTVSIADISGSWGFQNDSEVSLDTSDSSMTVDAAAIVVNFASDEAGSTADHLVATAQLSQSRDLSQIDQLTINANELGVTID